METSTKTVTAPALNFDLVGMRANDIITGVVIHSSEWGKLFGPCCLEFIDDTFIFIDVVYNMIDRGGNMGSFITECGTPGLEKWLTRRTLKEYPTASIEKIYKLKHKIDI